MAAFTAGARSSALPVRRVARALSSPPPGGQRRHLDRVSGPDPATANGAAFRRLATLSWSVSFRAIKQPTKATLFFPLDRGFGALNVNFRAGQLYKHRNSGPNKWPLASTPGLALRARITSDSTYH